MSNIRSMTGFGRAETVTDEYRVLCEIKSVNHRYMDLSVKMPRRLNCFESRLRQLLRDYLERGKTDLFITYEDYTDNSKKLVYNSDIAAEYIRYLTEMGDTFSIRNEINTLALARFPEVFNMEETSDDDERIWEIVEPVVRKAAENFTKAREKEGENLREDLLMKLDCMSSDVAKIEQISPSVVDQYRERLYAKIKESLEGLDYSVDEGRIVTEVAIYSDKVCTDEEMVRLKSHIDSMKKKLCDGGVCGRELDFIAQEMNREANTTLSKANSLVIADTAISLKTSVEKVREQVQNIE